MHLIHFFFFFSSFTVIVPDQRITVIAFLLKRRFVYTISDFETLISVTVYCHISRFGSLAPNAFDHIGCLLQGEPQVITGFR